MSIKVLVTGAAGMIGSHLSDKLIDLGFEVIGLDNLSTGKIENLNKKMILDNHFYQDSITNKYLVKELFEKYKFNYVFHCAAEIDLRKSFKDPIGSAETNILGSLNLIEQSVKHQSKFIFSSTGGAIYASGELHIPFPEWRDTIPSSPYGLTKLTIENYLKIFHEHDNLSYVALRYSNVYGTRQAFGECGVLSIFINKLLKSQSIIVFGDGNQIRDYIHVSDVVNANIKAMELSGVYNVGTGEGTSLNEIILHLNKYFGMIDVNYLEAIPGEMRYSVLNCDKLKRQGWSSSFNLDQGIAQILSKSRKLNV